MCIFAQCVWSTKSSNASIITHTGHFGSCHAIPVPLTTHIHNYELMKPGRENEGHVQLEMKHKPFAICLFIQTRAETHTHLK